MHREPWPQPRMTPLCAYGKGRQGAFEPADRHASRLGILGHVECRGQTQLSPMPERRADLRERLAYAALVAAPLLELASTVGWSVLPGTPLSTMLLPLEARRMLARPPLGTTTSCLTLPCLKAVRKRS